jgi:hypothetical protein
MQPPPPDNCAQMLLQTVCRERNISEAIDIVGDKVNLALIDVLADAVLRAAIKFAVTSYEIQKDARIIRSKADVARRLGKEDDVVRKWLPDLGKGSQSRRGASGHWAENRGPLANGSGSTSSRHP